MNMDPLIGNQRLIDIGTKVAIKGTKETGKVVQIDGTTYTVKIDGVDDKQTYDRKQLDFVHLLNWFISPIHHHLSGDGSNSTERDKNFTWVDDYVSGQTINFVKANSAKTKWIVKTKSGQSYLLDKDFMDTYFVKNHFAKTLQFLNEFP